MLLLRDIFESLNHIKLITFMVFSENKSKYKRTLLGPWWVILSMGFGSLGLGVLWTILWDLPAEEIIPSVTIGFLVWNLILGSINEGVEVFVKNTDTIKNVKLPLSYHVFELIFRHFTNFFQSLVFVVLIWLYYIPGDVEQIPFFVIGILITAINIFLLVFILGFLNVRFRDIQPLVLAIMPLLFFLSPILFRIQQVKEIVWLMYFNPFTYLITIIRDPLIGKPVEMFFYLISFLFIPILYFLAAMLFKMKFKKMVFWL